MGQTTWKMASGCALDLLAILALVATSCGSLEGEVQSKRLHDTWDYKPSHGCEGGKSGVCGPNEWSTIPGFESCAQQGTQSPIDMPVGEAEYLADQGFSLEALDRPCGATVQFELNEHTVEVSYSSTNCSGKYHATWQGHRYVLLQFHYHSPSENLWDGGHFPMEVHYVHKCLDCGGPEFMVLASMIGVGEGPADSFLRKVLGDEPTASMESGANFYEFGETFTLAPYSFLPQSIGERQLYFEGSMTTPPCNPGPTHWVMARDVAYVDQSTVDKYRELINSVPNNQLATFGTIEGKNTAASPVFAASANFSRNMWNGSLGSNNRPIQPLRGHDNPARKVYLAGAASSAAHGGVLHLAAGFVLIAVAMAVFAYVAMGKPHPQAKGSMAAKTSPHREPLLVPAPPVPHGSRTSFSGKLSEL